MMMNVEDLWNSKYDIVNNATGSFSIDGRPITSILSHVQQQIMFLKARQEKMENSWNNEIKAKEHDNYPVIPSSYSYSEKLKPEIQQPARSIASSFEPTLAPVENISNNRSENYSEHVNNASFDNSRFNKLERMINSYDMGMKELKESNNSLLQRIKLLEDRNAENNYVSSDVKREETVGSCQEDERIQVLMERLSSIEVEHSKSQNELQSISQLKSSVYKLGENERKMEKALESNSQNLSKTDASLDSILSRLLSIENFQTEVRSIIKDQDNKSKTVEIQIDDIMTRIQSLETNVGTILERLDEFQRLYQNIAMSDQHMNGLELKISQLDDFRSVHEVRIKNAESNAINAHYIAETAKKAVENIQDNELVSIYGDIGKLKTEKAGKIELLSKVDASALNEKTNYDDFNRLQDTMVEMSKRLAHQEQEYHDISSSVEKNFDKKLEILTQWITSHIRKEIKLEKEQREGTDIGKTRCLVCDQVINQNIHSEGGGPDPLKTSLRPMKTPGNSTLGHPSQGIPANYATSLYLNTAPLLSEYSTRPSSPSGATGIAAPGTPGRYNSEDVNVSRSQSILEMDGTIVDQQYQSNGAPPPLPLKKQQHSHLVKLGAGLRNSYSTDQFSNSNTKISSATEKVFPTMSMNNNTPFGFEREFLSIASPVHPSNK